ncbi:MAG TPA: C45 family peptidase [Acidobacteriota bacterium]|nr:C45 family peptidase [Acidobacteriota bacterium]
MRRKTTALSALLLACAAFCVFAKNIKTDSRLEHAFLRPAANGWTLVHLEGGPAEIGYQHGYLLARRISDMWEVARLELIHDNHKDWTFFRNAARDMMWPRIESEYRDELQGIAAGVNARGVKLDLWDIVALNGLLEWGYYVKEYDKQSKTPPPATPISPEHCSAFVATGSYTKDGKVVIAHNNWTNYLDGERWTIIFDIVPAKGNRILMDGLPGLIASDDDFGINSAGIMITETTISGFEGYDPTGIPEFVRARKAMQYSASIDDFARIMKEGNNGGYANDWLVADRKTNEIASLELGLKNVTLERKADGYFVGSNFPINPKLAREETDFDTSDMSSSANARHMRWDQLMAEYKGKIDVSAAQRFLSDHYDTFQQKDDPNERTLCGHVDLSPRGLPSWQPPFGIAGAVQNKVTDSEMAQQMSLRVAAGHACGIGFKAGVHLRAHPEYKWQAGYLRDMPSHPWTTFSSTK